MSSTRYASANAPLAQGRYMSAPAYAETRGLCGTAVAAKASILDDARARSLVFFLDALSRRPGGLRKVAADFLAAFPERIGTPSMHRFGMKPGQVYNSSQVKAIRDELEMPWEENFSSTAAAFLESCRARVAAELEGFLVKLCIDPAVRISIQASEPGLSEFRDIIGALLEFKARHEQAAAARVAHTEITSAVSRTLSRGLRTRRIVIANGVEGAGKSFGAEAWCEQHLGEARFIPLRGIVNKTTLFQSISRACGLAAGDQQKSQQMQTRVESYLERSGIMLVIDEAHRLFSQTERMTAHPELMNWVYTLWDMKIPVALLTTPQFIRFMDHAEQQTGWNSGQFKRRVEKWEQLPARLGEEDLRAVACKLAARYTKSMIDELVDFAFPARRQLDALKRALSAAELFASDAGRETPNARDLDAGIKDAQATDLALTTPLDCERQAGRRDGRQRRGRIFSQPPCNAPADSLQGGSSAPARESIAPSEDTLTDTESPAPATSSRRLETVPV